MTASELQLLCKYSGDIVFMEMSALFNWAAVIQLILLQVVSKGNRQALCQKK